MRVVLDTNILVDYLNGVAAAAREIARGEDPAISIVSWMEVLVGCAGNEEKAVREFLSRFELLPIDPRVADRAVEVRRARRIRLPDSIIWATALAHGLVLVTRNSRDFPAGDPSVRIPYRLP